MINVDIKWNSNSTVKTKEMSKWTEIMKKIAGIENYAEIYCNSFLLINNALHFTGYNVSGKTCSSYGVSIDLYYLNKKEGDNCIDLIFYAMNVNKADHVYIPFSEFETIMNNYLKGISKNDRWESELIRKYGIHK